MARYEYDTINRNNSCMQGEGEKLFQTCNEPFSFHPRRQIAIFV